ncbi:MAG: GNAT family N-acetyltransferase [Pseudomonadales bacterium]|nr:GNAT family N-acetyltransferase [Pseudomonadales bacterium]
MQIFVRDFKPCDQRDAETLINANLCEHFGLLKPELNPDLFDIAKSYLSGTFIVAVLDDDTLVGTGSLMPENITVGRIARMHTSGKHRRLGIASRVLHSLEERARSIGYVALVLETNNDWYDAISFYQRHGYLEKYRNHIGIHFRKLL